jgi:hypothetical protein
MAVIAALYRDGRSAERHAVSLDGTLRDPEWNPYDVVVEDLSSSGFRMPARADLEVGAYVSLGLPGVGICPARVVRQAGDRYGCAFLVPLNSAELGSAITGTVMRPVSIGAQMRRSFVEPKLDGATDERFSGAKRLTIILGLLATTWAAAFAGAFAILAE